MELRVKTFFKKVKFILVLLSWKIHGGGEETVWS